MIVAQKHPKYYTVAELAAMLKISRVAVFNKIKKGQIPAERIGRNYAIKAVDVAHLIQDGTFKQIDAVLTEERKEGIKQAVKKIVAEYGETLRLLGKE